MTTEEIENFDWQSLTGEDRKTAIRQLQTEAAIKKTQEQSNKLVLNSIYGSSANRHFYFYNKDLAEAITIQGQDAIRFSETIINKYFHKAFHKDTKLLNKLAEVCPGINTTPKPCVKPFVVYIDTDSCYVTFEEVVEKIGWTGSATDLILTINEVRLNEYLKNCFSKYAEKFNTESYLDFELETISQTGIWVKKKKYIQDIVWEDGKFYNSKDYIKSTGLEIIRSDTPQFCRKELVRMVEWIFEKGKHFTQRDIIIELLKVKKQFAIADLQDICKNTGIGDYEKYVISDINEIELADKCGAHIKAAANYNYLLKADDKYKKTYQIIKTGEKVLWYYTQNSNKINETFAFKRNEYPREFAPEVDIDVQFEKVFINPLNNIIKAMKEIGKVNGDLKIINKLF